jgi:hypothetical protein
VVPRTDVIRLQREIADLEGQLASAKEQRRGSRPPFARPKAR